MNINEAFKPSILLCESHFHYYGMKGVIADAVERVADDGFFHGIEIPDIVDRNDRNRIARAVQAHNLKATCWMSFVLINNELNLSSSDTPLRKKSVAMMIEQMEACAECGAGRFAVLSGPDPGPLSRAASVECLYTSLCELCEAAGKCGDINITLEPLDRDAHKNGLIGPTADFIPLISRVKESHSNIGISWDSAHVALCGDDIFNSLAASKELVDGIHLANAVLDRNDSLFGDNHMKFGAPGFLTKDFMVKFFEEAVEIGLLGANGPCVSIEVRTSPGGDPWETEAECRNIFKEIRSALRV